MATETIENSAGKTPLELIPALQESAEEYSAKQGVSLNEFINTVLAEKLAHLQHEEWLKTRKPMTEERRANALSLLEKNRGRPVMPGDELPEGYTASRQ